MRFVFDSLPVLDARGVQLHLADKRGELFGRDGSGIPKLAAGPSAAQDPARPAAPQLSCIGGCSYVDAAGGVHFVDSADDIPDKYRRRASLQVLAPKRPSPGDLRRAAEEANQQFPAQPRFVGPETVQERALRYGGAASVGAALSAQGLRLHTYTHSASNPTDVGDVAKSATELSTPPAHREALKQRGGLPGQRRAIDRHLELQSSATHQVTQRMWPFAGEEYR
jgi:hypothetical protein